MSNPLTDHIAEKIFSVTEYLELVNELLGPLRVSVEGEITDLKMLPQWVFFSLKDAEDGTVLRCGLHSGVYRRLGVNIEEGMNVKIEGYGKISPKTGNFGFWVSKIEPVGEGALKRAYELLVEKLKKEGLFTRKRDLPEFISHIGVVSSRNGVVVQDLLQNLQPLGIKVDFVHSGVEGADSSKEILRAIKHFTQTKNTPDVLVLIRGGGSLESLQGFNNEEVVRELYASPVPVLVGIGHDVDAPIATMVADWSASTPTAVAHVINKSWSPLTEKLPSLQNSMLQAFTKRLRDVQHKTQYSMQGIKRGMTQLFMRFAGYESALKSAQMSIQNKLSRYVEQTERSLYRICEKLQEGLLLSKRKVVTCERLISVSDPTRILTRGYGLVYNESGKLVKSVESVTEGDTIVTKLSYGIITSNIITKNK